MPKKSQKIVKLDYRVRLFNSFLSLALAYLIVFSLPWASVYLYTKNKLEKTKQDLENQQQQNAPASNMQLYKKLDKIIQYSHKKIQEDVPYHLTNILQILVKYTDKLYVTHISYKKETNSNKITISGIASDRDTVLALKTELEAKDYIKKVELPINSLLKSKQVQFSIGIILN